MYWLFAALAVAVLVWVGSGVYVFVTACVRRKDLPWFDEQALSKTPYGKYYQNILMADRWLAEHNAQDVWITSEDGLKLHGLWVAVENPRGTVLFAHGYRSTMLVDFGLALSFYHERGMNLLIPEQRSHGKSEGRYITFGVKESRDMLSWLSFHNREYAQLPVILSGLSMGASTMLYLADEKLPDNVKGIIADCGFTSPKEILSVIFKKVTHLPSGPSLWITDLLARWVAGFSLTQKDTRRTLAKNTRPIVMIHGTADKFVPCYMTQQGYEACQGHKQLLLAKDAGHGVSFLVEHELYSYMLTEFLKANVDNTDRKKD